MNLTEYELKNVYLTFRVLCSLIYSPPSGGGAGAGAEIRNNIDKRLSQF